jgi:Ca2+-binding EF-hand superfamily protein
VFRCATTAADDPPSTGNEALFDRLDRDHNAVIAADEVAPESRRLFDRLLRAADANHDRSLSRDEFIAGLVPSRPEKSIEAKQPASLPQADAVRYLLLSMDKNQNSVIEPDEIAKELKTPFQFVLDRLDNNKNGRLERQELSRGGPAMAQLAARYVERERIDVKAELAKLEKAQGDSVNRFDDQPNAMENLRDPKKARQLFAQFDQNGDKQLEQKEVPEPLQQPLERLMRMSDRDGDGRLSESEFLAGSERLNRFLSRRDRDENREKAEKSAARESKTGRSQSADKK